MAGTFHRLEAEYRAREARARHAAFLAQMHTGTLGTRTTILLLAAADADLTGPTVVEYRIRLVQLVGVEIRRRYPGPALDEHPAEQRYTKVAEASIAQEREALEATVLPRETDLGQKIDTLCCRRLAKGVRDVNHHITTRLTTRMDTGWEPDPDRYWRDVIEGQLHDRLEAA